MKKNLEKIFASASMIIAIVLIMILIVAVFGGIEFEEFESTLVRGLLVTLSALFFVLSALSLTLIFLSNEVIKEIIVRNNHAGSDRATVNVVRKLVKSTCKEMEGIQCKKVAVVVSKFGVVLTLNIKVKDTDAIEADIKLRAMLEDQFVGALGYQFNAIEIKIVSLKSTHVIDKAAVAVVVEEKLEEIALEQKLREQERADSLQELNDKVEAGEDKDDEKLEESEDVQLESDDSQEESVDVEEVTTEEIATEEIAAEEVATEEVIDEEIATEEVATEEIATEEVATEEIATETKVKSKVKSKAKKTR